MLATALPSIWMGSTCCWPANYDARNRGKSVNPTYLCTWCILAKDFTDGKNYAFLNTRDRKIIDNVIVLFPFDMSESLWTPAIYHGRIGLYAGKVAGRCH